MMTTTELAVALDTTPRNLRKFLRSADSGIESVGKGARYSLPSSKREVGALTKRFNKWAEAQVEARKERETPSDAPETDAEVEVETDETPLDEMTHPLDN